MAPVLRTRMRCRSNPVDRFRRSIRTRRRRSSRLPSTRWRRRCGLRASRARPSWPPSTPVTTGAGAQAEREALARMDRERCGHMVEGPESASAAEHQPAARPADEPAAAFHEKDAMRLEGEEEYLRQENEAAERARAARAAAAPPA